VVAAVLDDARDRGRRREGRRPGPSAEVRPPFSAEEVVGEFATQLRRYRIRKVTGDRYAGEWPAERFRKQGITYTPSEKAKSAIYNELLPLLNSRKVELLDDRRLVGQLLALERRMAWGGRDSIDHPPGGHDDVVNAVAGALVLAAASAAERRPDPRLGRGARR
jgi:hypothetical protein